MAPVNDLSYIYVSYLICQLNFKCCATRGLFVNVALVMSVLIVTVQADAVTLYYREYSKIVK